MKPKSCVGVGSALPPALTALSTCPSTSLRLPADTQSRTCAWVRASGLVFDVKVAHFSCVSRIPWIEHSSTTTHAEVSSLTAGLFVGPDHIYNAFEFLQL